MICFHHMSNKNDPRPLDDFAPLCLAGRPSRTPIDATAVEDSRFECSGSLMPCHSRGCFPL